LRVLVVNAGSSSLKLSVVGPDDAVVAEGKTLESIVAGAGTIDAVGHRIVHGGPRYSAPTPIEARLLRYLRTITDLAPLHLPASLRAIEATRGLLPRVPQVACFDTAFHAGLPPAASTYAIPPGLSRRYGLRRYGFHGFSHAYAARRAAEMLGRPVAGLRVVTCHLGSGASLAAVKGGRSVDTTMGFTPLEGLVMATRSGTIDPGLVLWLQRHARMTAARMTELLDRGSGLKGLAASGDMRHVLRSARQGDAQAKLAFDVYVHRLRALIASMAAALGGVDAVVFTGGVGENSREVRGATVDGLGFLGLRLDRGKNSRVGKRDVDVSAGGAAASTLVVHAREDVEVAREVRRALAARVRRPPALRAAGRGGSRASTRRGRAGSPDPSRP